MSYTGTQVYFPAGTAFTALRDALAAQVSSLTATAGELLVTFDNGNVIRVAHDTASHVPDEATELADRADAAIAAVLAKASHRVEITPADPGTDPDDVYNELLLVFETLRALPNAVGLDPFDGQLYLDAPAATPTTKRPVAKPKTAAKRPTKKTVAKRPTKKATKRPTKTVTKRPTKAAKRPRKASRR